MLRLFCLTAPTCARTRALRRQSAFSPRARAQLCVLLWSNPPRACVRDLIICAEMGATRALARDRGQFVWLHHQPASFEHSSKVKFGWYSSHHLWRSVAFARAASASDTLSKWNMTMHFRAVANLAIGPIGIYISLSDVKLTCTNCFGGISSRRL